VHMAGYILNSSIYIFGTMESGYTFFETIYKIVVAILKSISFLV
jgi:hypothetical protein